MTVFRLYNPQVPFPLTNTVRPRCYAAYLHDAGNHLSPRFNTAREELLLSNLGLTF
jgi:hypothetical protein